MTPIKPSSKITLKRKWKLGLVASAFGLWAFPMPQTVHGMESYDDKRPPEHFCPITLEVMKDPVVAPDGHSYEREAIEQYLRGAPQAKSPLTGAILNHQNLVANQALKSMIQDWKPCIQSGPSVFSGRSATDIAQQIREEFKRNEALLDSAKERHIVAFLGNTGAGKSTLVNLLAGKKIKVGDYGEDYVLINPNDPSAMVIGTTGNSETLYPKSIDIEGLRFFDLPGFNDTDGSERNLVNAAFARKILLDAATVRLVFVVGQDQFTADRSASVRQMFNSLKNLFVLEQTADLVDNGVCVVTKVTCTPQANMTEFLLQRTASMDKADLNKQLQSWSSKNQLCRMFHPLRDSNNQDVRDQILERIREAKGAKVQGINVSALYPSGTQQDLERVFLNVLEEAFIGKLKDHPVTLTEFNEVLGYYTLEDFWRKFSIDLCQEDSAVGLLKEFSGIPYAKALTTMERQNREKLKQHIQGLERSFVTVLEKILEQKLKDYPVTLTGFNQALEYYTSKDFWLKFSADLCKKANAIALLKNSSNIPYVKALTTLEKENAGKLIEHIHNLEGMFVGVLEKTLLQKKGSMVTLTEYDQALKHYASKDFWSIFSANLCSEHGADELLQENIPYTKAIATLKQQNTEKLKQHIEDIREERQKRVQDIEKRTEQRAREVIASLVPQKADDNFITFDFAYHRDIHDHVCGVQAISQLATDPIEQEVARSCYAGVISQHSHNQMMRWHEKFSGVEDLKKQLEATQQKLYALVEEPLIKAREAEEERQGIKQEAEQREKQEREAEQSRIKTLQEVEFQERKAIFSIREAMTDECINQYKILTSPTLTYEQLYNACTTIYSKYDRRAEYNKVNQITDKYCELILSIRISNICGVMNLTYWTDHPEHRSQHNSNKVPGSVVPLCNAIKDDVIESMDMYERLYGNPHPRKGEISKM